MSETPPVLHAPADITITPFSEACGVSSQPAGVPSSQGWTNPGSNVAIFVPLYLAEPFTVAKAFWGNGATVGTDNIDVGVYRMTDRSTGRMDLIRSTGATLSAGTINQVQEVGSWKVARTALTSSSSSTDASTYTTASVTLKRGRLYLLSVENSHGSSASAVSAVTSATAGVPTFTSRSTTQFNGTLNRVSIWSAVPTDDWTGTLVINFGGTTQTGGCWALTEMSGVDTTTTDGIVQNAVGTGNSGTALATLAAFGSANNATFGAQGHASTAGSTAVKGFTELHDVTAATPAQALQTEWRVGNDTTVDATFTSAQWGACAVEVKADASAFIIPPAYPASDIYMAMSVSGTTCRIFMGPTASVGLKWAGWLGAASCHPLLSTVTAAATANMSRPLFGFSSRSLIG